MRLSCCKRQNLLQVFPDTLPQSVWRDHSPSYQQKQERAMPLQYIQECHLNFGSSGWPGEWQKDRMMVFCLHWD